jgi:uncharacterized protein with GYD domain
VVFTKTRIIWKENFRNQLKRGLFLWRSMPKYLFAGKYTVDGVKGVMREGGTKRREAAEQAVKSAGGKLESFYYAFGDVDVYGIAEFPDQASAVALSAAINSSGTTAIKLTPLITVEEVDQATKKMTQYRAPGK